MQAICLKCRNTLPELNKSESGKHSCDCGEVIPYRDGIYQFVQDDEFYEGKFVGTRKHTSSLEKLIYTIMRHISIDGNEERMWSRSTKYIREHRKGEKLEILNIGAGGGHDFLNDLGIVNAVDLSFSSLHNAQNIYDICYQADATNLPFPDNSFDLVFSSHLLGHIPLQEKQSVIKELYRVTKKNGYSLHSAECEGNNFIYKQAKKYPDLYKKYFQDMYGHYGLEYPSLIKKRFRQESFKPVFEISDYCKGIVRQANSYKVFFGAKEYYEKQLLFRILACSSKIFSFNLPIRFVSGIFLYPLTIINRILGPDSVDSVKLLYRK